MGQRLYLQEVILGFFLKWGSPFDKTQEEYKQKTANGNDLCLSLLEYNGYLKYLRPK